MTEIAVALIPGIATIVAAALTLAVSFDKRSKLLKTIEIYEKLCSPREGKDFDEDSLLKLKREIEWQIEVMANPRGSQIAIVILAFMAVLVAYGISFSIMGYFEGRNAWNFVCLTILLDVLVFCLVVFYSFVRKKLRKRFMEHWRRKVESK